MSPGAGAPIDWQEAHARLDRLRRALEREGDLAPDDAARVLRERARALARPLETPAAPVDRLDLVVFTAAGERFGVDAARVHGVLPLRGLTPVPCTPPFVLGIVLHRGRVLTVLDLGRFLGIAGDAARDEGAAGHVVVVSAGAMMFGLHAETLAGLVRVPAAEIGPPTGGPGDRAAVRGVTAGAVAVLDLVALARDPRIVVNEEVG